MIETFKEYDWKPLAEKKWMYKKLILQWHPDKVIEEEKNNFDEPFTINVLERDHNTGEVVVKNEYKIDPFQA